MKQIEQENFQTLTPLTDIVDTGEQLELFVEMPGVKKEDTTIELERGSLKIKGITKTDREEDEKISFRFSRAFNLSRDYQDAKKIDASNERWRLKAANQKSRGVHLAQQIVVH